MKTKNLIKAIPLWQAEKIKFVKTSTYFNYMVLLEKHIMPFLKSSNSINKENVQNWVLEKLKDGLSLKTTKCLLIVLNNIVKFCADKGIIQYEKFCVKFPQNISQNQTEILTKQQHKHILQHIKNNFSFKNLGIYICLSCGLRIGEVCALTWNDVNLEKQVIAVNKTLQRVYSPTNNKFKTEILIDSPKTINAYREIPLNRELVNIIKNCIKLVNNENFIISNNLKPIEPRSYRNYYKKFMKNLEMPTIKFHCLRHSFATRCIESKCDYKTLSSLLGHANISTTLNLYTHPNLEQKKVCINKMISCL